MLDLITFFLMEISFDGLSLSLSFMHNTLQVLVLTQCHNEKMLVPDWFYFVVSGRRLIVCCNCWSGQPILNSVNSKKLDLYFDTCTGALLWQKRLRLEPCLTFMINNYWRTGPKLQIFISTPGNSIIKCEGSFHVRYKAGRRGYIMAERAAK